MLPSLRQRSSDAFVPSSVPVGGGNVGKVAPRKPSGSKGVCRECQLLKHLVSELERAREEDLKVAAEREERRGRERESWSSERDKLDSSRRGLEAELAEAKRVGRLKQERLEKLEAEIAVLKEGEEERERSRASALARLASLSRDLESSVRLSSRLRLQVSGVEVEKERVKAERDRAVRELVKIMDDRGDRARAREAKIRSTFEAEVSKKISEAAASTREAKRAKMRDKAVMTDGVVEVVNECTQCATFEFNQDADRSRELPPSLAPKSSPVLPPGSPLSLSASTQAGEGFIITSSSSSWKVVELFEEKEKQRGSRKIKPCTTTRIHSGKQFRVKSTQTDRLTSDGA